MPNIGLPEVLVVLVIALIVFGPKRLPELGRSLGQGIREFKRSVSDDDDEDEAERRELQQARAATQTETAESVEGEAVTEKRA